MQEFPDSLSGKVAQKVAWVLNLVEDLDVVPSTYLKKLVSTEEIWEYRIQFGLECVPDILLLRRQFSYCADPRIDQEDAKDPSVGDCTG